MPDGPSHARGHARLMPVPMRSYAHPAAPEAIRREGQDMGGPTYGTEPAERFGGAQAAIEYDHCMPMGMTTPRPPTDVHIARGRVARGRPCQGEAREASRMEGRRTRFRHRLPGTRPSHAHGHMALLYSASSVQDALLPLAGRVTAAADGRLFERVTGSWSGCRGASRLRRSPLATGPRR